MERQRERERERDRARPRVIFAISRSNRGNASALLERFPERDETIIPRVSTAKLPYRVFAPAKSY